MAEPIFVQHNGARILILDYSRVRGSALKERVAEAGRLIARQPPKSLLILARLFDVEFSPDSTRLLLDHMQANAPFSLSTAVVGLGHLSKAIPIANRLTGRDIQSFDDETAALDWLASVKPREPSPDERVRFMSHKGDELLYIDFRDCSKVELERNVMRAASIIRSSPPGSLLTLTLLHGLTYNEDTTRLFKDYVRGNRPYVLAAAVVGLDYLRRIIFPLNRLTGRKLRAFDDIENAKDWLVDERRRLVKG